MGLFDIFSAKSGQTAAQNKYNAVASGFDDARDDISKYYNKANTATDTGYNTGVGATNTGYDQAGNSLTQAYSDAQNLFGDAHNYLQQGTDQAVGAYGDSNDAWQGLYDRGTQGIDMYGTLSGLNGGEAGMNAFQNTPDYLASRAGATQGLDSIGRSFAGGGQTGRAMEDAMKYMSNYDMDVLGRARGALSPYFGLSQAAAGGLGNNAQSLAQLLAQGGKDQAGVSGLEANAATRYGENNSDLATGRAGALTNLATDRANALAGNYTNRGNAFASLDAQKAGAKGTMFQDKYAANQTADMNQWNALLTGVKTLASMA